ncbi:unnamed protein product [Musa acuminata subsp. malaccensis]|uniref:(wild Malaysian banana) hypothetical protein n=1 Tax=Musa acuminata subsp. malaccensis TaxID=214687 RepID=A0A804KXM0_MUSAM|nr:unnamed protein product [Musa acuminata subsp. malaccensis]
MSVRFTRRRGRGQRWRWLRPGEGNGGGGEGGNPQRLLSPLRDLSRAKKVDVEVAKPIVSCIPDLDSQYADLSSTGPFSPGCWKTFDLAKMLSCLHNMLAENL